VAFGVEEEVDEIGEGHGSGFFYKSL
jgi:hypothetical protein